MQKAKLSAKQGKKKPTTGVKTAVKSTKVKIVKGAKKVTKPMAKKKIEIEEEEVVEPQIEVVIEPAEEAPAPRHPMSYGQNP